MNKCAGCDLCCRKYRIYLFPSEAKKISRHLKINFRDFVEKYLDLYFEIFTVPKGTECTEFLRLPETFGKNKVLFISLAIKQKDSACVFLEKTQCRIYDYRPTICKLFPYLKLAGESYDFCKLDSELKEDEIIHAREKYYPILRKYLSDLNSKGIRNTWKYLPKFTTDNIVLIEDGKNRDVNKDLLCFIAQDI